VVNRNCTTTETLIRTEDINPTPKATQSEEIGEKEFTSSVHHSMCERIPFEISSNQLITLQQTTIAMEHGPFEDVFPAKFVYDESA